MQAAALVNGTNLSLISHVDFVANTPGFQTVDFPGLWKDPHEATYYLNYNVPPERLVSGWSASALERLLQGCLLPSFNTTIAGAY